MGDVLDRAEGMEAVFAAPDPFLLRVLHDLEHGPAATYAMLELSADVLHLMGRRVHRHPTEVNRNAWKVMGGYGRWAGMPRVAADRAAALELLPEGWSYASGRKPCGGFMAFANSPPGQAPVRMVHGQAAREGNEAMALAAVVLRIHHPRAPDVTFPGGRH